MRPRLFMGKFVVLSALAAGLAACATMGEQECSDADWYTVGFDDGAAGYSLERIDEHREACASVGEGPDEEAWRAGREDGLTHFCSAAGGIAEGSRGRIRSSVCPPALAEDFIKGFRLGREIYDTHQEMDRIEREIRALEARASGGLLNATVKNDNEARIRQLEYEYDRLGRNLRLLELRADRLAEK